MAKTIQGNLDWRQLKAASRQGDGNAGMAVSSDGGTFTDGNILIAGSDGGVKNSGVPISSVGAGGLVLVEQHTASASAELDFTSFISSDYDEYLIEMVELVPTSSLQIGIQFSIDGATWCATASYVWEAWLMYDVGYSNKNSSGDTAFHFDTGSYAEAANASWNGTLRLYNPQSTRHKFLTGQVVDHDNSRFVLFTWGGKFARTEPITGMRFIAGGTNTFASGTVRVYGLSK